VGALVVHTAVLGVREVSLCCRALELGQHGVQALVQSPGGVPVLPGDVVERLQRRRLWGLMVVGIAADLITERGSGIMLSAAAHSAAVD